MNSFSKVALACAFGAIGMVANASTLVFDYSGKVNLTIPAAYADLYDIWNSNPAFSTFSGTVILPDFENYLTGTHTINLNTAGIQVSLNSGILTGIEGTRTSVTGPNPAYDATKPTCTTRAGCDLDGDGVREVAYGNLKTVSLGQALQPDATQTGDYGSLTIVDGKVAGFTWGALSNKSPALAAFNTRLFDRGGFPVNIGSVAVTVNGSTPSLLVDDVYFAQNIFGTAQVNLISTAVPEPESYALMLAGLGVVGFSMRRLRKAA